MIYRIQDYYDVDGASVKEFIVVEGEAPEDFPKYVGVGMIGIELQGPNGVQTMPRQFTVNLDAKTLKEAFEKLPEAMKEAAPAAKERFVQELREHQMEQQKKIIVPR